VLVDVREGKENEGFFHLSGKVARVREEIDQQSDNEINDHQCNQDGSHVPSQLKKVKRFSSGPAP
jgi:hypothetical protein